MTIICYRDGVMAADSQVSKGNMRYGTATKVRRLPNGSLFGAAGTGAHVDAAFDWFAGARADKPVIPLDCGFRAIIAEAGAEYPFEIDEDLTKREMRVEFAVVGENQAEAMCIGAMALGGTAEQAVRIAIEHCVWVGGPVQVEKL